MSAFEGDLKIGAVFSLASPEKDETEVTFEIAGPKEGVTMVTYNNNSNDSNDETPTVGDNMTTLGNEITSFVNNMTSSVMSTNAKEASNDSRIPETESVPLAEAQTFTKEKKNDEITPTLSTLLRKPVKAPFIGVNFAVSTGCEDVHAPPCLLKESVKTFSYEDFAGNLESIAPPVLHPEVLALTNLKGTKHNADSSPSPEKKRKIDPSYIVLTSIDPWLGTRSSVPCIDFAHAQNECTNMCKKISFKRRLARGDDVFNVKTPSKQKDYQVYLEKYEKAQEVNAPQKPGIGISIKDLLNRQDKGILRGSKGPAKRYSNRVRRTVVHVPVDFKTWNATPEQARSVIIDDAKKMFENREEELLAEKRAREKVYELETLGKLIEINRKGKKRLKKLKKAVKKNTVPTEGTISLCGRVRKSNPRYSSFFVDNIEVEEKEVIADMMTKIKAAREVCSRKFIMEEERYSKEVLKNSNLEVARKHKQKIDIVIERVDEVEQPEVAESKPTKGKEKPKVGDNKRVKHGRKRVIKSICKRREAMRNGNSEPSVYAQSSSERKATPDGVLIQNLPNESSYVRSLLTTKSFSHDLSRVKSETLDSDEVNKHAATSSTAMTLQVRVKSEPVDNGYEQANDALFAEQFKKFKVPDKVKQLFINKTRLQIPTASAAPLSGAASGGVDVIHPRDWTALETSTQYPVLSRPVVSTTSTETLSPPKPSIRGRPQSPLNEMWKSQQTVADLLRTKLASKPPLSHATHTISNMLHNKHHYHVPSPPVSVILPKPNMRPQVMFIPVTTTGKIVSSGVIRAPVHPRFPLTARSLVPVSLNGQNVSSGVTRHASPVFKVENNLKSSPQPQQNVTVVYPMPQPSTPVQSVASNRASSLTSTSTRSTVLLTTSSEPKKVLKVFPPVPTTHKTNDAGVKTVSVTGSTCSVTANPATPNTNAKFYLLKVDGKNILIPMATDGPPMAYVIDGAASLKSNASTSITSPIASATTSITLFTTTTTTVPSVGANNRLVIQSTATSSVVNSQGPSQTTFTQKVQTPKTSQSALRYTTVVSTKPNQTKPSFVPITSHNNTIMVQLQTLSTKPLNKNLNYVVSQKTSIGDDLKRIAVATSANETISNSSLTTTSSGAHIAQNKTETHEFGATMSTSDVKEKRDVIETSPFLVGVTGREERLRKLKELFKEKQKAVDEIRQQIGML
ncbi:uncharacterized protein LOC127860096 [Dreissena polymorpha]|uniref:Uncharacterized protein n=1 Tax=Dreissena polymorpha TaxID=45954 RepID=A0A9D3YKP5_DREPO|nr:uncharacterized protein LOC127860096 [Dreissena polymorpha]XP_052253866.1 uncharacterized protein LOC127860096 [Dreissena polymorpha]XP_052253867.1 uncharacterized protein LOC127860096 [Dreissena polymorpha]XP_052253868.1 uncharacterized protein LOC127860096 [Dreissena polymorpha]XP_052253869.1 uncharacterized protein LOC127860096 [Dreissena polymorpha]KAH3700625.1 hypothetical protein DPMN_075602 [Dreissena polymorpha]